MTQECKPVGSGHPRAEEQKPVGSGHPRAEEQKPVGSGHPRDEECKPVGSGHPRAEEGKQVGSGNPSVEERKPVGSGNPSVEEMKPVDSGHPAAAPMNVESQNPAVPQSPSHKLPQAPSHQLPSAAAPMNVESQNPAVPQAPSHQLPPGSWTTGLFDCFDDCEICCITYWCPCITFGRIAEIVDKGSPSCGASALLYFVILYFTGCACLLSRATRSKLRSQYGLEDAPCSDCCVHFWCESCALCQEYRELKNRGFDMSLGWQGHLEKQATRATTTPPHISSGMSR